MRLIIAAVIIVLVIIYIWIIRKSKLNSANLVLISKLNPQNLILEPTKNIAFNQYCPYRAMLGTWKNDRNSIKVKLYDPDTLQIGEKLVKNPTCRIGKFIEVKDNERNEVYKISDGKCIMPNSEIYNLI